MMRRKTACPEVLIKMAIPENPDIMEKILDMLIHESISKNDPGLLKFEEPTDDFEYGNILVDAYDYISGLYTDIMIGKNIRNMIHQYWHSDCLKIISAFLDQNREKHVNVKEYQHEQKLTTDDKKKAHLLLKAYEGNTNEEKFKSISYVEEQIKAQKRFIFEMKSKVYNIAK